MTNGRRTRKKEGTVKQGAISVDCHCYGSLHQSDPEREQRCMGMIELRIWGFDRSGVGDEVLKNSAPQHSVLS